MTKDVTKLSMRFFGLILFILGLFLWISFNFNIESEVPQQILNLGINKKLSITSSIIFIYLGITFATKFIPKLMTISSFRKIGTSLIITGIILWLLVNRYLVTQPSDNQNIVTELQNSFRDEIVSFFFGGSNGLLSIATVFALIGILIVFTSSIAPI